MFLKEVPVYFTQRRFVQKLFEVSYILDTQSKSSLFRPKKLLSVLFSRDFGILYSAFSACRVFLFFLFVFQEVIDIITPPSFINKKNRS